MMELNVYDTAEDLAGSAAARIAELVDGAEDRFSLGLAGGSTPRATYVALRDLSIDWSGVDIWLSDERWVPPDHERSNGRMAAETLTDHIAARFHRPPYGGSMMADESAPAYEATLESVFAGRPPDLVLLGMGEDAHTASLFPGSPALEERGRIYVANTIPETGEQRLTATYPLLWSARRLIVLTAGESKAPALRDAFDGVPNPIGQIDEGDAEVEWHVDRAAASLLS